MTLYEEAEKLAKQFENENISPERLILFGMLKGIQIQTDLLVEKYNKVADENLADIWMMKNK